MKFTELKVAGAYLIEMEPHTDHRGYFARTWCEEEMQAHGLTVPIKQCSTSFNPHEGTLRGLHYQAAPNEEAKYVRCTRGAVFDVVADIRSGSSTYLTYDALRLTEDNARILYIPEGCAHGFLTLLPDSEVHYKMTAFYSAAHSRGVAWDDPDLAIEWPMEPQVISDTDRGQSRVSVVPHSADS